MKPLNVRRESASAPPQTAASSSPSMISSAAWPIAIVLDEQAATMQDRVPSSAKCVRDDIDRRVREVVVDLRRARAIGAVGDQREEVVLVAQQVAGAGAKQHADPLAIDAAREQARFVERLGRRDDAELLAPRPATALERREARLQIEEIDLARDSAAKIAGVEERDRPQAAETADHVLPVGLPTDAERRDQADAGNGDARRSDAKDSALTARARFERRTRQATAGR